MLLLLRAVVVLRVRGGGRSSWVCVQVPVRLREVVYTLSPFEQTVMNGLFKDLSYTVRANIFLSPLPFATWRR